MKCKSPQDVGRDAERGSMRRVGARRVRGSGAWDGEKGDGRLDTPGDLPDFLIEHKATQRRSFSVQLAGLQKAAREARQAARQPAFHVVFCDGTGRPVRDGAWVMVPENVWRELVEEQRCTT